MNKFHDAVSRYMVSNLGLSVQMTALKGKVDKMFNGRVKIMPRYILSKVLITSAVKKLSRDVFPRLIPTRFDHDWENNASQSANKLARLDYQQACYALIQGATSSANKPIRCPVPRYTPTPKKFCHYPRRSVRVMKLMGQQVKIIH